MAGECPEGSGPMGDDWAPAAELLEERELLSGALDGLSELAAGATVEETAVVPDPGAEEPPAVVAPLAEVSAGAVSSPGAPNAPAMVGAAERASAPALTAGASDAPVRTTETPAAVEHSTAPGAQPVDSLLAKFAVDPESHANSTKAPVVEPGAAAKGPAARHAADLNAAEAHAAAEGQARASADATAVRAAGPAPQVHAVNAPAAGSVSAHDAGIAETRVGDGERSADGEWECLPTEKEAAQPPMTAEVSAGERTAETVGHDMPTIEDNQPEEVKAPIERSLVQSAGDRTASDPSRVDTGPETTRAAQTGEVSIIAPADAEEELVSRVSQLFDLVPNWPGVDLDALEDAARSRVDDGAYRGADFVAVVSTHDVSRWATAAAGTAVGFGIARRELGLQTRDSADAPTDEDAERRWSST